MSSNFAVAMVVGVLIFLAGFLSRDFYDKHHKPDNTSRFELTIPGINAR